MESGVSGLARSREWDVVTSATCEGEEGEAVFVALEGSVVAERGPAGLVECARRALAALIEPPYRAVAVRRDGTVWAVGAVAIEVARLPFDGDELTLVVTAEGERSLTLDGRESVLDMHALGRVAGGRFDAYVLQARRLDADLWEVQIDPL